MSRLDGKEGIKKKEISSKVKKEYYVETKRWFEAMKYVRIKSDGIRLHQHHRTYTTSSNSFRHRNSPSLTCLVPFYVRREKNYQPNVYLIFFMKHGMTWNGKLGAIEMGGHHHHHHHSFTRSQLSLLVQFFTHRNGPPRASSSSLLVIKWLTFPLNL